MHRFLQLFLVCDQGLAPRNSLQGAKNKHAYFFKTKNCILRPSLEEFALMFLDLVEADIVLRSGCTKY